MIHKDAEKIYKHFYVNRYNETVFLAQQINEYLKYYNGDDEEFNKLVESNDYNALISLIDKSLLVRNKPIENDNNSKMRNALGNLNITSFGSRLTNLSRVINSRLPNIKFLSNELNYVEQNFSNYKFSEPDNEVTITTDDVILNDFNFGQFNISLNLDNLGRSENFGVSVFALDPRYSHDDDKYPHPHVENTTLCLGNGTVPVVSAMFDGRINDYFQVITSILNTYGVNESPFRDIEYWTGGVCCDCECGIENDYIMFCAHCNNTSCGNCSNECCDCYDHMCYECATMCECGNRMCKDCINTCSNCYEYTCGNCMTSCSHCGDYMCSNCILKCDYCNDYACNSCKHYCESCNSEVCSSCIEHCNCGQSVCRNCVTCCELCGSYICHKCITTCVSCNLPMCSGCLVECEECCDKYCDDCESDELVKGKCESCRDS